MGHIFGYSAVFILGWIVMPQPKWADRARQWCYVQLRAFVAWVRTKTSGTTPPPV